MNGKSIVTFGEIMIRINPNNFQRFKQVLPGSMDLTFGGSEFNVASSLAILGEKVRYVTALPDNTLTDTFTKFAASLKIDTNSVLKTDYGRFGIFFLETGANQRSSNVVYDRDYSSISMTGEGVFDWNKIFSDAKWFHVSGITPALSEKSASATIEAMKIAKEKGLQVSLDLNYRKKLWGWNKLCRQNELAGNTIRKLLPLVDILIGNEEDADKILGIRAGDSNVNTGLLEIDKYPEVASRIAAEFPEIRKIGITLRESISASHNNWGGMLYDTQESKAYFAPEQENKYKPYEIRNIVDRVGGGDAFGAGLIYALNDPLLQGNEKAISFAAAASCLSHSILGDINYSSKKEVEDLVLGSGSGRVVR